MSASSSFVEETAALRAENAALRAEIAALRGGSSSAAAASVTGVAAAEEDEQNSLPDNRDVAHLLAYLVHAARIYADRSEVPTHHACMSALPSGVRIDVCKNVVPVVTGIRYAIHPSRLYPSELYFVRDERDDREADFFAFYDRLHNRIYRSIEGLQAALTATYGCSDYGLVVRADREGTLHSPLL